LAVARCSTIKAPLSKGVGDVIMATAITEKHQGHEAAAY
jgi:hypothetical protein